MSIYQLYTGNLEFPPIYNEVKLRFNDDAIASFKKKPPLIITMFKILFLGNHCNLETLYAMAGCIDV